jgi:serine/threonine-protein phosphatase 4 catalytic subunit
MWSDPDEISGWGLSPRGAGYLFGGDVVEEFNRVNSLTLICRAHQLIMEGYREMFNKTLVTIWSAPNYCYRCNNVASILRLDENLEQKFIIFEAATHVFELNNSGSSDHSRKEGRPRVFFVSSMMSLRSSMLSK